MRPRKYATDAERQAAYRQRQKRNVTITAPEPVVRHLDIPREWLVELDNGLQSHQLLGGLTELQADELLQSLKGVLKKGAKLRKRQVGEQLLITSL